MTVINSANQLDSPNGNMYVSNTTSQRNGPSRAQSYKKLPHAPTTSRHQKGGSCAETLKTFEKYSP